MEYTPVRPFNPHQRKAFDLCKDEPVYFLAMEQRTRKTKIVLDKAVYGYQLGRIDALLIVAPNGVHRNWVTEEIPADVPDSANPRVVLWRSGKMSSKRAQADLLELLSHPGLSILSINAEALSTSSQLREYLGKFLRRRKVLTAYDESSLFKTPGVSRTRVALQISKLSKEKICMDGTPNEENPLELWSQYNLLDPNIIGLKSFYAFKGRYARIEQGYDPRSGRNFDKVVGYQNIEDLQRRISPYTFRITRREAFPGMPEKVYQKHFYELSEEQRRVYDEMTKMYRAELRDAMEAGRDPVTLTRGTVTASMVLTRYLRLQQIVGNWAAVGTQSEVCGSCMGHGCENCDDIGVVFKETDQIPVDPSNNPRIVALGEEIRKAPPTIVWARFSHEITDIVNACRDLGRRPVRHDGKVSDEECERAKSAFRSGDADTFIANQAKGGRGLTLTAARLLVYYSNYHSARLRGQSEDRGEDPNQKESTGVIDIVAQDTIDETIIGALRAKKSLAQLIQGDPQRPWI